MRLKQSVLNGFSLLILVVAGWGLGDLVKKTYLKQDITHEIVQDE